MASYTLTLNDDSELRAALMGAIEARLTAAEAEARDVEQRNPHSTRSPFAQVSIDRLFAEIKMLSSLRDDMNRAAFGCI